MLSVREAGPFPMSVRAAGEATCRRSTFRPALAIEAERFAGLKRDVHRLNGCDAFPAARQWPVEVEVLRRSLGFVERRIHEPATGLWHATL